MANQEPNNRPRNGGQRPVPDPTSLTTEQLQREIGNLRELLLTRLEGDIAGVCTRLEAEVARVYTRIEGVVHSRDVQIAGVETQIHDMSLVREEQFRRVNQQLDLVERGRVEQKQDTQSAVQAALLAQKDAVREQTIASERSIAKSETATNKQLEQLATTFQSEAGSLRRSIDELKERITGVDNKASAVVQQKIGANEDRSGLYAGIGIIATVLVLGLTILGILIGVGGN